MKLHNSIQQPISLCMDHTCLLYTSKQLLIQQRFLINHLVNRTYGEAVSGSLLLRDRFHLHNKADNRGFPEWHLYTNSDVYKRQAL